MRCSRVSITDDEYVRWKSSAVSVCTMAGTLSRSIPAPCSGDGATTTISGSTVCAAAPPGWASNPAPSATPKAACRAPRRRGGLEAMRTLSPGGFLKNLPPAGATSFGPPGSEVSVPLGKPGGKIWQRDFTATLRVRHTRRRAPCRAKQRLPVSAVGLLQQAQQGLAGAGTQFLVVQGAVVVRIGGLEPLLDLLEILVLGQGSVLVGIRSVQLLGAHAAAQLAPVQRALVVTVELVEHRRGRLLGFIEIDRSVVVGIERLHHPAAFGRRGGRSTCEHRGDRQSTENGRASRHHGMPPCGQRRITHRRPHR